MLNKRMWLAIGAGSVFLIMVAVTAYTFFIPQEPRYTGPVEDVRVGNVGEYSVLNIIAQDQGFFTANGINATITEFSSGAPSIASLLEGGQDVAIAGDFVGVTHMFQHKNLQIVAQTSGQNVFQVVARKDKGITYPTDLKGKRVAVTKKSAGEFFLGRFANLEGFLLTDMVVVDMPPAEMVQRLASGDIDALVTFEPHAYNLKKALGGSVVSWSAQGSEKTMALLFTTQEFSKNHPDTLMRYLKALSQAEDFLQANPQKAREILANSLQYSPEYVEYLWPKIQFGLGLQQELILTMEDQARFSIENKLTPQTTVPNYLNFIYFDAMEALKPEYVTITH